MTIVDQGVIAYLEQRPTLCDLEASHRTHHLHFDEPSKYIVGSLSCLKDVYIVRHRIEQRVVLDVCICVT